MTTSTQHRDSTCRAKGSSRGQFRLAQKLFASMYRFTQRCIVLDITKLLIKESVDGIHVSPVGDLECKFLTDEELLVASQNPELGIEPEMVARIRSGLDECVAALDQGQVAGYLWLARQGIEAEHNCGNHPLTGVAVSYQANTAFVYKVFSLTRYRGRRIFPALVCYAAETLERAEGITRLVSTTDWTNSAALAGFRRAGFFSIGHVFRFVFGKPVTHAPASSRGLGILLGDDAIVPQRIATSAETVAHAVCS